MRKRWGRGTPFLAALLITLLVNVGAAAQSGLEKSVVSVDIPSVQGAPDIDGVLDDNVWNSAARIEVPVVLYQSAEESDLSGEALVYWNASGLYVGIRVTDDDLLFPSATDDIWQYDSAAFWMDNLWVQATLDRDGNARLQLDYLAGFPPFESSYDVAASSSDTGYVIEAHIPASVIRAALGYEWRSGEQFRFAVGFSDRDEGDAGSSSPRYFPNWFGWNNVTSMAVAILK